MPTVNTRVAMMFCAQNFMKNFQELLEVFLNSAGTEFGEFTTGHCNYHAPLHELDDLGHYHWKYQHNIDNRKHNPVENNHAANLERDHVNLDYNYERTDDMQPWNFEELRVDPAHNTSEITRKSTEEHEFHRRFLIHKCWPRSFQYQLAS